MKFAARGGGRLETAPERLRATKPAVAG